MSDSARYSRLLHPKGQGCPLFRPQPFDDLPPTLRQTGTRIGDVGIVTPNGAFDPIFNILDRAEDNHSGVPQGFEQVRLRHNAIMEERLCYPPGSDISSTTIEKRRLGVDVGFENNVFAPAGVGAVVEVSTNSKETAMLLLPDGASRWDLRALRVFRDYALKHAPKWYEFVNGDLGRMIGNGDLYLVTGVTKSTSWSVAALENQSGDGQVSLKLKAAQVAAAGVSYAWEWESASSSVNSGPHRLPGEESWRDNQTVFVRGFKVCLRTKPLRRSPKLLTIVDSKWSDLSSKSTFVPFSDPRPESSSTTDRNFPSSPAGTSGSDSVSDGEESLNYVSNLPHPSDGINEFLLDYNRDAIVAVTHDDELNSILTEADDEVPENHELISRILKKFTVETTSDGVYLQARSTDKSVFGPSGQQAVLDNVQMDGHYQPPLTSSTSNSSLKDSTVDYPDYDCPPDSLEDIPGIWCTVPEYADSLETTDLEHLQIALGEQNMVNVTQTYNCILPLKTTRFHSPISLQMRTPPGGSWSDALTIDSSSSPTDTHPSSPLIANSGRDSPAPAASPAGPNHFRKRTLLIGVEGTDGPGSSKHGTLYDLKRFLNDHIPHSQNHHASAEPVIETTGTRDFPSEVLPELSASSFTTKNIAPPRLQVVADSMDSSCLGPTVLQTAEEEEAQFVKSPICDDDTNLQKQRVLSWINDTARPLVQALPPIPPDIDRTDHRAFYCYTPNEVKHRKRTSSANLRVLENVFKRDTKPNEALRTELAAQLNMTARGVQVWFQNRRAKEKNKLSKSSAKSTDYDCLSLRLPENRATYYSSPEGLSASSSPRPTRTDRPRAAARKDPNQEPVEAISFSRRKDSELSWEDKGEMGVTQAPVQIHDRTNDIYGPSFNGSAALRCLQNEGAIRSRFCREALVWHCQRSGDLQDPEAALWNDQAAVAQTPDCSGFLNNLAGTIPTRFQRRGAAEDIDEAIQLHREALELRPAPHPERASSLNNPANLMTTRFQQLGTVKDIDEAIQLHREALALCPTPHPMRAGFLNNLACAFQRRFQQRGTAEDIDEAVELYGEAVELYGEAVELRPAPCPVRATCLNNLAGAVFSLDLTSRQKILVSQSDNLGLDTTACAINLGKHELAIELLEAGRSVFWAQALQFRTCLDDLRDPHPQLATKLRKLSLELERGSFRDTSRNLKSDNHNKAMSMEEEEVLYTDGTYHGRFTTHLVSLLKQTPLESATCAELVNLTPKKWPGQTPYCGGARSNRLIFNGNYPAAGRLSALLTPQESSRIKGINSSQLFPVEMGTVEGVVPGTESSAYDRENTYLGTFIAQSVRVGETILVWKPEKDQPPVEIPPWSRAVVSDWTTPLLLAHAPADFPHTNVLFPMTGTVRPPNFVPAPSIEEAHIALRSDDNEIVIELRTSTVLAGQPMTRFTLGDPAHLPHVIDSVAHFSYFLDCANEADRFEDVTLEMHRLRGEYPCRTPDLEVGNMIKDGAVGLTSEVGAQYGFTIRNMSDEDLFPYLFYSDPEISTIQNWYSPAAAGVEPPLRLLDHAELCQGIIPYDSEAEMIVDNNTQELNAALVALLPAGSYLVAVLDTCSLLDLKHSWCNRVIVPWIPRGKRNSEEIRHRVVRRDARIFSPSNTLSSVSTAEVDFGGPSRPPPRWPSTRLLARQNEINMNLMCRAQPAPNTGSVPPVTGGRRASSAHSRTFTYRSRTVSLASASTSRENALALSAEVATPTGAAQSDVHPALPGKFWVLSEDEQRCESPVAMFECNGWCRDRERDGERNDTDGVKPDVVRADVVSLASCKDSEITWEDGDGKSMTASLVEILRCDPHQSLKDVLVHISHAMYTNAHIRHTKARAYKNRHKQFLANIAENILNIQRTVSLVQPDLPPTIAVSPTFPVSRKPSFVARQMNEVKRLKQLLIEYSKSEECDMDCVQNPELTSARPLDMNRQWKM